MKYHQHPTTSNKFLPHRRHGNTLRYHFCSDGGSHRGLNNSVSPISAPRRVVYCQDASLLRNLRQSYVRRGASSATSSSHLYSSSPPVVLAKANRFHAQLKFPRNNKEKEYGDDDEVLSVDSTSTTSSPSPSSQNTVRFDSRVSVVEIPNRNSYSPEQKEAMWSSRRQIRKAAYRNSIEHAFEKGDWRRAVEEEYFYYDENNGNWVHPAHVVYMHKQRQQQQQQQQQRAAGYGKNNNKPIVVRCSS